MYEAVYAGGAVEELILKRWPNAKIKDASDFIHTERFECEIPDLDPDEFYIWAILEGYAGDCLAFNVIMRADDKGTQRVWDLIAEADAINESEGFKYRTPRREV